MTPTTKASFWDTNVGKTLKAAGFVAVSSVISYVVTATTNNPSLFGPVTVLVNIVLVFVQKTFLDSETPNVGAN